MRNSSGHKLNNIFNGTDNYLVPFFIEKNPPICYYLWKERKRSLGMAKKFISFFLSLAIIFFRWQALPPVRRIKL